jgi:hypothetical protein
MPEDKVYNSKQFKYAISSLDDVVEHLDSLWELHNQLAADPAAGCQCTDPPCSKEHGKNGDDNDQGNN